MITAIREQGRQDAATAGWLIPDNLRQRAEALMVRLEANGSDVCQLMAYHLWLMLTSDTPDDWALQEDVDTMTSYLDGKGGQGS